MRESGQHGISGPQLMASPGGVTAIFPFQIRFHPGFCQERPMLDKAGNSQGASSSVASVSAPEIVAPAELLVGRALNFGIGHQV